MHSPTRSIEVMESNRTHIGNIQHGVLKRKDARKVLTIRE